MIAGHLGGHLGKSIEIRRYGPVVLIEEFQPYFSDFLELFSFLRARLAGDATQGCRVKIIVSKDDVSGSQVIKFVCLLDDFIGETLARLPSVCHPYGTEAAIFGGSGY